MRIFWVASSFLTFTEGVVASEFASTGTNEDGSKPRHESREIRRWLGWGICGKLVGESVVESVGRAGGVRVGRNVRSLCVSSRDLERWVLFLSFGTGRRMIDVGSFVVELRSSEGQNQRSDQAAQRKRRCQNFTWGSQETRG